MVTTQLNSNINFRGILKIVFIPLIVICFLYQGCNNSAVTPDEANENSSTSNNADLIKLRKDLNDDITYVAKYLAAVLKNESCRRILEEEKNAANNREEILDASVFLNKAYNIDGKNTTFISEMSKKSALSKTSAVDNKEMAERISSLSKGLIDIYFPIDEHRDKWKSSDSKLYVVIIDQNLAEADHGYLKAYDIDGNEISIDAKKVPSIPCLAVCISETHGNYPPKQSSDKFFQVLQKNAAVSSVTSEATVSYLKVYEVFVRDAVGEDIFLGDPEYYLNVWHPRTQGEGGRQRTNFYDCTESGTGYANLNRTVCVWNNGDPYSGSPDETRFEFWEDDGGLAGEDDLIEDHWGLTDPDTDQRNYWIIPKDYWQIYWGSREDIWIQMKWISQ